MTPLRRGFFLAAGEKRETREPFRGPARPMSDLLITPPRRGFFLPEIAPAKCLRRRNLRKTLDEIGERPPAVLSLTRPAPFPAAGGIPRARAGSRGVCAGPRG